MESSLVATTTFGFGLVGLLGAIFFWRKASHLHQVLSTTISASEEMREQCIRMQRDLSKFKDMYSVIHDKNKKLEAKIKLHGQQLSDAVQEQQNSEKRRLEVENRANILIERYKDETTAAEHQCAVEKQRCEEMAEQLAIAEKVRSKAVSDEQERHKETARILKKQLSDQQSHHQEVEKDLGKMRDKWVDPEVHFKLKRKVASLQRVYQVLKGQKDMAEEKLENWDQALRVMSQWVLKKCNQPIPKDHTQSVMMALDAARISLVHDEFQSSSHNFKIQNTTSASAGDNLS